MLSYMVGLDHMRSYGRFEHITLLAAQTDFGEPGEVLDSKQMGAPAERYKPLGDAPGDYVCLR